MNTPGHTFDFVVDALFNFVVVIFVCVIYLGVINKRALFFIRSAHISLICLSVVIQISNNSVNLGKISFILSQNCASPTYAEKGKLGLIHVGQLPSYIKLTFSQ